MNIEDNYKIIQEKIEKAAERAKRRADEITLVSVSKNFPAEMILKAYACGARVFGESRVPEALEKMNTIDFSDIQWHFIGHLQKNKINKVLHDFHLLQSVDSIDLLKAIESRSIRDNSFPSVLIEVNTSEEDSKFGFSAENLEEIIEQTELLKNVKIRGLMTIALYSQVEKEVRSCFQKLKKSFDMLKKYETDSMKMEILSMGMSHDFEWAIDEGSNMIRIGTALFGNR